MKSLWHVFVESFTEDGKGSGKRMSAFLIILIVGFLCIYPTLKDKEIPETVLFELLGFVAVLYGISWAITNTKSKATPNNNANPQ